MPNETETSTIDVNQLLDNIHPEIKQRKGLYDKFIAKITTKEGSGDDEVLTPLPYAECAITALNIIYETSISGELVRPTNPNGKSAGDVMKGFLLTKHNPYKAINWDDYKTKYAHAKSVDTIGYTIIGICIGGLYIDKFGSKLQLKDFVAKINDVRNVFCPMEKRIGKGDTDDKRLDVAYEPLFDAGHIFGIIKELIKTDFLESSKQKKSEGVNPQEEGNIKYADKLRLELLKEGDAIKDIATDEGMTKLLNDTLDEINNTLKQYKTNTDVRWVVGKIKNEKITSLTRLYKLYSSEVDNILEKDDAEKKSLIQSASMLLLDNLHETFICASRAGEAFPNAKRAFKEGASKIYSTMQDVGIIEKGEYEALCKNSFSSGSNRRFFDFLFNEDTIGGMGDLSLFQAECKHLYEEGDTEYNTFTGTTDIDAIELMRCFITLYKKSGDKKFINEDTLACIAMMIFRNVSVVKTKEGEKIKVLPDFDFINRYIQFEWSRSPEDIFKYILSIKNKKNSKVKEMVKDTPLLLNTINIIKSNTSGVVPFTDRGIEKLKTMLRRKSRKSSYFGDVDTRTVSNISVEEDIAAAIGGITLFIAPTNYGKTARQMHMSLQYWKAGDNVVIFSGEDIQDKLVTRILQNSGLYKSLKEVESINNAEERERLFHALTIYRQCHGAGSINLFTQNNDGYSTGMLLSNMDDCTNHLMKIEKNRKIDCVMLDYVNKFKDDTERDRWGEVVIQTASELGGKLGCRFITAMQAKLRKNDDKEEVFGSQTSEHNALSTYIIEAGGTKVSEEKGDIINTKFKVKKRKDGVKEGAIMHSVFYKSLQFYVDIPYKGETYVEAKAEEAPETFTDEECPM